ncbi:LAMI_0G15016g1_1 [Lachancea mirantina]|uniref:Dipeptidyl peptidase 3 n=1 Tax=Lachancea mirantina TaxID=1230905 RepID=A0A1G4KCD8_9SACH|nr:LAMI_0G15016g1_1 [Lachancea mirantina]
MFTSLNGLLKRITTKRTMTTITKNTNLADAKAPQVMLSAKTFFDQLTSREKLYAHYMSKASHCGTRIVLRQVSHESESIYDLIMMVHSGTGASYPETADRELYFDYISQFLANLGNYKSFGDTKFVPRCSKQYFYGLLELANIDKAARSSDVSGKFALWQDVIDKGIFEVDEKTGLLGFPATGYTSSYYFGPVSDKDMVLLKHEVFAALKILPENTRIKKLASGDFEILVASASRSSEVPGYPQGPVSLSNCRSAVFKFGDHCREMAKISEYLRAAQRYAANDEQGRFLAEYIRHFETGSSEAHKESQKIWVKDISPVIETNIGFIETYREPSGIIGEFESLVAIQNKNRTAKFSTLVKNAEKFIKLLPWGSDFEKPKFQPPDFTSLEVLTFAGSGIPAGINIPNYDDVRLNIGFKNVSLGNILNVSLNSKQTPTFIKDTDLELFRKYQADSFEVQVGIHELLGHGSGKLMCELEDGTFNFDVHNPPHDLSGNPVKTYYRKGETWGSKFGSVAGPFEECRAELIAMYLITNREILSIFGFDTREEQNNIIYAGFLQMARAGLVALEFWDPSTRKWGQPHMQARFAIMKTLLNHANGSNLLTLDYSQSDHSDLTINLNRSLIESQGHDAIAQFLHELHIYKCSGDQDRGTQFFLERSDVDGDLANFRSIVIEKKLPRRQIIQANTDLVNDEIKLKEYEESPSGMLQSFLDREV